MCCFTRWVTWLRWSEASTSRREDNPKHPGNLSSTLMCRHTQSSSSLGFADLQKFSVWLQLGDSAGSRLLAVAACIKPCLLTALSRGPSSAAIRRTSPHLHPQKQRNGISLIYLFIHEKAQTRTNLAERVSLLCSSSWMSKQEQREVSRRASPPGWCVGRQVNHPAWILINWPGSRMRSSYYHGNLIQREKFLLNDSNEQLCWNLQEKNKHGAASFEILWLHRVLVLTA